MRFTRSAAVARPRSRQRGNDARWKTTCRPDARSLQQAFPGGQPSLFGGGEGVAAAGTAEGGCGDGTRGLTCPSFPATSGARTRIRRFVRSNRVSPPIRGCLYAEKDEVSGF
jgi:hypothetical protein